jgi:hypothetical protein
MMLASAVIQKRLDVMDAAMLTTNVITLLKDRGG